MIKTKTLKRITTIKTIKKKGMDPGEEEVSMIFSIGCATNSSRKQRIVLQQRP
ncbi:MAG: hypothetical protein AAFY76_00260 [Cyanobacteria bacterium J06649_11]